MEVACHNTVVLFVAICMKPSEQPQATSPTLGECAKSASADSNNKTLFKENSMISCSCWKRSDTQHIQHNHGYRALCAWVRSSEKTMIMLLDGKTAHSEPPMAKKFQNSRLPNPCTARPVYYSRVSPAASTGTGTVYRGSLCPFCLSLAPVVNLRV